ncbi:MAG: glycosyltransferase [Bacillota bacterium]
MIGSSLLISLCMIVKDEENNIGRSLESVKGLVDEMVIIDTGSEDKTVQKAKEFGAQIHYFPWQNDFSAARNHALSKAKGLWILFLDADESLGKVMANKFRKSLRAAKEEGFYLTIFNYQGSNQGDFLRTYSLRLFRNNCLYKYEGKIHEQILPSIKKAKPQALIGRSQLIIHHYGYLEEEFKVKNKAARNLEILLGESSMVKKSAFYCLNLAMEYIRIGELSKAEEKLKEGWKNVNKKDSYAHGLLLKLIACLYWQEKNEEAIEFCKSGLTIYPDYSDVYYYYGVCLAKVGDLLNAKKILLEGLNVGESSKKYISQGGSGSYLNLYTLGQIEEQGLNFHQALDYYLQALRLQPQNFKYLRGLIRVLLRCNVDKKSFLIKNNLLTTEYLLTIINEIFKLGDYSLVNEIVSNKKGKEYKNWDIHLLKGKSLLMLGKYNEALESLDKIPQNKAQRKEALFYSWIGCQLQEKYVLSKNYLEQIRVLDPGLYNLLIEIDNLLQFGCKADNDDYKKLQNNECVLALLHIIDTFAACKAEKSLEKIIRFLFDLTGEEFRSLVLKVLFKHKCYEQAIQILKKIDLQQMDEEEKLIAAELYRRRC